ncbi:putative esterase [Actinoplanes tereljensis]|uniref:Peptidase S9 prolyl oligopeptidase catalytic domain-containing protein n=1 Tax=Paractinoplanes tereljensis TaxID=571912 RepID=A0A919NV32_9ACTN|nr:PHB depolymerase family esterase [Actinoplanes tereljensis]GIF24012.1 hypothetical protein Ate02nite_67420 [Actinoplanes tereljensis]
MPISRRTVLTAAAGLALPLGAARTRPAVGFTLNAETLDGGEQVTSLTLHAGRLGPLDPAAFRVHATATSPIPLAPGDQIFSEYDLDRPVTAARRARRGNIVLDLSYAEGQLGGGTLGYIVSRGRNVRLNLVYTITHAASNTRFLQGGLVNPEVDAFGYHASASGLKYRLYSPGHARRRPLIVWLHGGGEGASLPDDYYDNETTLRANRGALGFATREAQKIFGGAHVVVPQSTSYWIQDGPRFAPLIREIVEDVARRNDVDRDRIYVAGCSNGGYMSMKMTVTYPRLFAASVPICGVVTALVSDTELAEIRTPSWLVASRDDTTVDPVANTVHAHDLIPRSRMTLYDTVTWNGYRFPGHWSWIYVARNDQNFWQWMARQRR